MPRASPDSSAKGPKTRSKGKENPLNEEIIKSSIGNKENVVNNVVAVSNQVSSTTHIRSYEAEIKSEESQR